MDGCSLRQRILKREFGDTAVLDGCIVVAGEFDEPYTGEHMIFKDKKEVSKVQIDHVVALSDAWQKGAQYLSSEVRYQIATDPLYKYGLWVTEAEKEAIANILKNCPNQRAMGV